MKFKFIVAWGLWFLASVYGTNAAAAATDSAKVVCYYDSKSNSRLGEGKFTTYDLELALQYCSHLIYRSAAINSETFKIMPLNENFDVLSGNYIKVIELKRRYPALKVLLSVGGNDDDQDREKYLTLLESVHHRLVFINSAHTFVKVYGFDGLDIGWEFPTTKPKKIRSAIGSFFHSLKETIVGKHVRDENAEEHRDQFTALVREVKHVFQPDNLLVTLSVLPNVNSSVYYDTHNIIQNLDFVSLLGFDYYNPERNSKEADFPAPLYSLYDRKQDENVDALVKYWLHTGAPTQKLVVGIPTFARAWKMTEDSAVSGVPPFEVDGPAEAGPYTDTPGLLSYPEFCSKIAKPDQPQGSEFLLKKVEDLTKRCGTYAFRLPDENEEGGIWIAYDDFDIVGNKASYVRSNKLGGVAIYDLTLDDFKGRCSGQKYPVLRAAKYRL